MAMEDEIQSKEALVKNSMELQENLDLKMLGLELSEELHRKKCDEQQKYVVEERNRLDAWES